MRKWPKLSSKACYNHEIKLSMQKRRCQNFYLQAKSRNFPNLPLEILILKAFIFFINKVLQITWPKVSTQSVKFSNLQKNEIQNQIMQIMKPGFHMNYKIYIISTTNCTVHFLVVLVLLLLLLLFSKLR